MTTRASKRKWLAALLTIVIAVAAAISIDRLEARADDRREGQLLLAQVEIAASRQALETMDVLAIGQVSGDGAEASTQLMLASATEEIEEYGLYGLQRLQRLGDLGADEASTADVTVAFERLQREIGAALTELRRGDEAGAYIYGRRRIRPTFEVIEDVMLDSTEQLGAAADKAHRFAQLGGAATLLLAMILLFGLRHRFNREKRSFEARLQHEALHDPLTDLPNRRLFQDRVNTACLRRNRGHGTALMMVDLDGFKQVNDTKGHEAGDRILAGVAERLRHCIRESDTVARIGGDEFAIVLPDVTQPLEVLGLAERIMDALIRPFDLGETTACVGASIGIAIQQLGEDAEKLFDRADTAMYSAKRSGRGAYCIAPNSDDETATPILGRLEFTAV